MSESLGTVLIIRIFLVFLALYIIFIAVTFNFLKAYKSKNYIVEYIEKNNGNYEVDEINNHLTAIGALEKVPAQINGNIKNCTNEVNIKCVDADGGQNYPYRIFKTVTSNAEGAAICYFEVEVYTTMKFLGLHRTMAIKGETKKVTNC